MRMAAIGKGKKICDFVSLILLFPEPEAAVAYKDNDFCISSTIACFKSSGSIGFARWA